MHGLWTDSRHRIFTLHFVIIECYDKAAHNHRIILSLPRGNSPRGREAFSDCRHGIGVNGGGDVAVDEPSRRRGYPRAGAYR